MELLHDFIDGELSEAECCNIGRHIHECSECRGEAESLRRLSRDAASLPKKIQPDKDLWPGIEAAITAAPPSESEWGTSEGENHGYKQNRHKIVVRGWGIAAAVMIGVLLLAGTYLEFRKRTANNSDHESATNVSENITSVNRQSVSSPGSRPGASVNDYSGAVTSQDAKAFRNLPSSSMLTYPLDPGAQLFVSNHGIYAVAHDYRIDALGQVRDWHSLFINNLNLILSFDRNGTQSWIPPLPPGSYLSSVYPGGGNRLWAAYTSQEPEFQGVIAELDFGMDSEVRNVWKSRDLFIGRFAVGPQGLIYAAGVRSDIGETVGNLTEGQSVSVNLLHIIDPKTGKVQDLFPVTLHPDFDAELWAGTTTYQLAILTSHANIAVKSNGNFFITIDQTPALDSIQDIKKNEAVEYFTDGTAAGRWDLGNLESDTCLNRIFVDIDDSILAEIIRHEDSGDADSPNQTVAERRLFRIDPNGRVSPCNLSLYSNEVILGWMGQTGELVTGAREGKMQQITLRRLPH